MGHVPKNLIIVFRHVKHYMPVFYMTKPMWFITVEWPINARSIACKKTQVSVSSCLQGAMTVRSKSGFLDTQIIECTNRVPLFILVALFKLLRVTDHIYSSTDEYFQLCLIGKYFWVAIFKGLIVLGLSHVDQ